MLSVHKEGKGSFIEQKSEFIGEAAPVSSEEEAMAFVNKIRELHPKATHHCYAYILGESQNIQRFSDDGEPGGTAGIPMLEVLKKQNLTNVCVVATRYFGGILLGAGGLVRAYTRSAIVGIEKAIVVEKEIASLYRLAVPYENLGTVDYRLIQEKRKESGRSYGEKVEIDLWIPQRDEEGFIRSMQELFNGQAGLNVMDQQWVSLFHGEILL